MEREFLTIIKKKLRGNIGAGQFARFMLNHINMWETITYPEIKSIVDEIKYHGSTYSFFPFCWLYLEIDLFQYYELQAKTVWKTKIAEIQIASFISYPISYEEKSEKLRYQESIILKLKNIKLRLLEEGAIEASVENLPK